VNVEFVLLRDMEELKQRARIFFEKILR